MAKKTDGGLERFCSKKGVAYVFIALCSFIMSMSCWTNPFYACDMGRDSAVFNYVARVIHDGGMPYRDTFDHKGPLIYLIDLLGQCINKTIGVWLIELIFIAVTLLFAYKLARLFRCSGVCSLAVVAISVLALSHYFEGGNLVEEYACPFIMVSLYIFVRYFWEKEVTPFEIAVTGFSFGAICLLRINMAVLWGVMCCGVAVECIRKKKESDIGRYVLWFLLGLAVILVPIMIWLAVNGALTPFLEDYFGFNMMYSTDTTRTATGNMFRVLYRFFIGVPTMLSFPIITYFCLRKKDMIDWLCWISLLGSLYAISLSGQRYGHYGMILVPIVTYAFSRLFGEIKTEKTNIAMVVAGACAVLMLFHSAVTSYSMGLIRSFRRDSVATATVSEIAEVIDSNSTPGDLITVCGNKDSVYLASDRRSASLYSYQEPVAGISSEIRDRYLSDIRGLNAKIIVIAEDNGFHNDLDDVIAAHYDLIGRVDVYEIFRLR